ncbi:MAG TPA: hypothetical protein VF221_08710, partial [Chloroflexota bacterium]
CTRHAALGCLQNEECMDQERVPYQSVLRAIGSYLDRHHANFARVIEVPDGFSVQYYNHTDQPDIERVDFTYQELLERSRGTRLQPFIRRPISGRRTHKGKPSYQNFLRALGYELEDAGAFSILVDELDDGYLLTYQFYDPDSGFMLHKHRVALHADEAGRIVDVAAMRRGRFRRSKGA